MEDLHPVWILYKKLIKTEETEKKNEEIVLLQNCAGFR